MVASKSKTCCVLAKKVSELFCTCAATPPDPRGQRSLSSRYITGFVDFTSDGTPVGVASGNLWLVRLATFILQPMEHTNHKFPAATATGVPSEVKSTVQKNQAPGLREVHAILLS